MPLIRSGAFDVDYSDAGSGPVVVLVHSSASGMRQWRRLGEALQGRYRVIALNLFGYGATSTWPATQPMCAADQAELVAAVMALTPEPVALVGHSLGGAVVLETAVRASAQVRAVIAFEPILFGYLKQYGPATAAAEIAAIGAKFCAFAQAGDWNSAGELFIDYWASPGTWAAMPDERRRSTAAMLPAVIHEWSMADTAPRALTQWRTITAPVHLIHAADTREPTRAVVRLMAAACPDWRVHEVPTGGHMAPLSRPDLVNPLIAAILDEAFARPAPAAVARP